MTKLLSKLVSLKTLRPKKPGQVTTLSEKRAVLRALLQKVIVAEVKLRLDINVPALLTALSNSENATQWQFPEASMTKTASDHPSSQTVSLSSPITLSRRSAEAKLIVEDKSLVKRAKPDAALIKTIARVHVWFEKLIDAQITMTELTKREGMQVSLVAKLLPLACLALNIVEAILAGHQSMTLIPHHSIRSDLPLLWEQQRAMILA